MPNDNKFVLWQTRRDFFQSLHDMLDRAEKTPGIDHVFVLTYRRIPEQDAVGDIDVLTHGEPLTVLNEVHKIVERMIKDEHGNYDPYAMN